MAGGTANIAARLALSSHLQARLTIHAYHPSHSHTMLFEPGTNAHPG